MSMLDVESTGTWTRRGAVDVPRVLADQAFARAAGAELIAGNAIRILRDATENFPAWLEAIHGAQRTIFFESYMIGDDRVGREFVAALTDRARAGVRVRVLYDWLGTRASGALFAPLATAGGEVRVFNRPRLDSPLGWLTRDHRKTIVVDGRIGFVSGLCPSTKWLGDAARGLDAWRDTGVSIRGPAVAALEHAFDEVWQVAGGTPARGDLTPLASIPNAGDVAMRVIASVPSSAGLFRLDQLVAVGVRERLWLTDAYFVGLTPYVQALCAAARDGVDVRLLVPGASDLPIVSRVSRAGYRPLLEAGVRVFEWNGSMLHAKTAIADGRWARVGSTNLNIASWLNNYELDIAVEDEEFARRMAMMYEEDLSRSTEIVLGRRYRVGAARPAVAAERRRRALSGSARRAAAGALSMGAAVGAVLTNRRVLGPAEANFLATVAIVLLAIAAVAVLWPVVIAVPIALLGMWFGIVMLIKAARLHRRRRAATEKNVEIAES